MTEQQLLLVLCKNEDPKAQKLLYEQYATRMFRLCLRYVKDQMEAEDILTKGFIKVFSHIREFEPTHAHSLESWIKRIMVNESLMYLRKHHNFHLLGEEYAKDMEVKQELTYMYLGAEEIYALILQLPLGYRTVFNLYAIEGFTHKEIATQLQISENTSKSQLRKARLMLKDLLKQHGIPYEN